MFLDAKIEPEIHCDFRSGVVVMECSELLAENCDLSMKPADSNSQSRPLRDLVGLFLRLGVTAFGGPAAHIAMMENEVVHRRQWLTKQEFLDLLGMANLIPGPTSTELAIFIGYRRAGSRGLILGGVCFILPAALIVSAFAWAYLKYGKLPQVEGLLYGIKPVIIAVMCQAIWNLGRTAVKSRLLALVGIGALVASYCGFSSLLVLVACALMMLGSLPTLQRSGTVTSISPMLGLWLQPVASNPVTPFSLWKLFLFFLKIGSVLFGSGYVLLAFLRTDLVERWHWLTENQLLDAVAVGQFTPGPVFTTATFIGYVLGGPWAAFVATVGIFLPSFILVAMCGRLVPRIRKSVLAGAFLDGVNVASLGLMAAVTVQLGGTAMTDWPTILLALIATALFLIYRINTALLVMTGGVAGWLVRLFCV